MMAFALAYSGFAALCLAMDRHHEQVFGRRGIPSWLRRMLTVVGYLLLAAALAPLAGAEGWGMALLIWLGLLTASAIFLALLLCYRPRAVPILSGGLLLVAGIATLF